MKTILAFVVFATLFSCQNSNQPQTPEKPNVILIMTDDQGYGDFGFTGNPHVKTPVLDELAAESIRFNNFYVSPVCAPTRSSLMTGRYSLRTGIRDTYNGGAIMSTDEITMAELMAEASYTTGIFGKWHLGDNYPSRPMDQGFDESLIHLSGGMGQVGDFTTWFRGDSSYFDPVLWHNGRQEAHSGYCSDIFADAAIRFIESKKDEPFFCYLAFNAPHTPLQLPQKYYDMYKDIDPTAGLEGKLPEMTEKDKEDARKVYGMVSNIDDNIGKLLRKLDELGIAENTILIFMTDNGPQQRRYTGGMRGRKGMVYRGGVRVPMLMKFPKRFAESKEINSTAAHIDILPTLADLCGFNMPADRPIDGQSLLPLIEQNQTASFDDRSLFFYWSRRYPELYQNIALQKGKYRLIGMTDFDAPVSAFELYDMSNDPGEESNRIDQNPALAEELKEEFDRQYQELISSEHLVHQPLISIGTAHENPVILNRNDAGGERGIWAQEEIYGKWKVSVKKGVYNLKFRFIKPVDAGQLFVEVGPRVFQKTNSEDGQDFLEMNGVLLPDFEGDLIPFYTSGGRRIFPFYMEVERVDF